MRVPLNNDDDIGRTMSRIPSGGFAVLDIILPNRARIHGALSGKLADLPLRKCFPKFVNMLLSSRGLGDFVDTVGAPDPLPYCSPFSRWKHPPSIDCPSCTESNQNRLTRVRIEARRKTASFPRKALPQKGVSSTYHLT